MPHTRALANRVKDAKTSSENASHSSLVVARVLLEVEYQGSRSRDFDQVRHGRAFCLQSVVSPLFAR